MKVRAFNIDWDTDGKKIDLPDECVVELDDDQDPHEDLANVLSDEYGWCVNGCNYEIVELIT